MVVPKIDSISPHVSSNFTKEELLKAIQDHVEKHFEQLKHAHQPFSVVNVAVVKHTN